MLDVPTIGVLRDLSIFVAVATVLALIAYRVLRHLRPEVSWNYEGLVVSRPYAVPDLLLLAGLGLFFIFAMEPQTTAKAAEGIKEGSLVLGMAFNLIVCAGLLVYLHQLRGMNPAELFGVQHLHWRSMGIAIVMFALIILISVNLVSAAAVSWLKDVWPDLQQQDMVKAFQESDGIGFKILVVIAAVFMAPLAEEVMFRGFVYGVLKRYTDAPFAALISSLMFAVIHMHVGSLLPLWMLAVLFCLAYEITGCLLVPMLLHAIFNAVSIIAMLFGDAP